MRKCTQDPRTARSHQDATSSANAALPNGCGLQTPLSGPLRGPLTPSASKRVQEDVLSVKTNSSRLSCPESFRNRRVGKRASWPSILLLFHSGSQERGHPAVNGGETFQVRERPQPPCLPTVVKTDRHLPPHPPPPPPAGQVKVPAESYRVVSFPSPTSVHLGN